MVLKKRKPHRKALIISVLDYPHVHHKHGGSTSGCFTDALLTARILRKYYGFDKIAEEEFRGVKQAFQEKSSSIRVCCTYSWGKDDRGEGVSDNRAEQASSTASTSCTPGSSTAGEEALVDSDCDVDHFSDTHQDVVKCLEWLAKDARKGDTLVLCFTGCSTYKCIETTHHPEPTIAESSGASASSSQPSSSSTTSTLLEPVLCLGDFSWENNAGFLNCETLRNLLLSKVDRASCELTVILDTYLGSSMAEMLQKEVNKNTKGEFRAGQEQSTVSRSVSGRFTHPDTSYHSLPWNRARCLKLPQNERKILRKIQSYKRRVTLKRVCSLATSIGRLKRYFKRLLTINSNRISPLVTGGEKDGRLLLSPSLSATPPKNKLDSLQSKYVFFAVESSRMGGVVHKNNVINFVKLGPLTWVFYSILKERIRDEPSRVVDMLHPSLSVFLESANTHFQHKWGSVTGIGRRKPYTFVMKTSDLGSNSSTYKLFNNVYSDDTLKSYDDILADRKLKDARTFSLTRDLARVLGSPGGGRSMDPYGQRHLENSKAKIAASPKKLEPLVRVRESCEQDKASPTNGVSSASTTLNIPRKSPPPKLPPLEGS